jgi:hypothetical protein
MRQMVKMGIIPFVPISVLVIVHHSGGRHMCRPYRDIFGLQVRPPLSKFWWRKANWLKNKAYVKSNFITQFESNAKHLFRF